MPFHQFGGQFMTAFEASDRGQRTPPPRRVTVAEARRSDPKFKAFVEGIATRAGLPADASAEDILSTLDGLRARADANAAAAKVPTLAEVARMESQARAKAANELHRDLFGDNGTPAFTAADFPVDLRTDDQVLAELHAPSSAAHSADDDEIMAALFGDPNRGK